MTASAEQADFIKKNHGILTIKQIARSTGLSINQVRNFVDYHITKGRTRNVEVTEEGKRTWVSSKEIEVFTTPPKKKKKPSGEIVIPDRKWDCAFYDDCLDTFALRKKSAYSKDFQCIDCKKYKPGEMGDVSISSLNLNDLYRKN